MFNLTKIFLIKLITILIIMSLSACTNSSPPITDKNALVDVAEITENLESYLDKSVLVRNDVIKTIGERGLILDKDRAFSGDPILVIDVAKKPLEISTQDTPEVLVRGEVKKLSLAGLQENYNLKLDSNLYKKYEEKPVIIADSLILSPDPEDLTQNPQAFYGKPLAIEGELEDIKNYGVFELDEEQVFGGEDLVVVQPKPRIKLKDEQRAIVYGTLRPFVVAELERDYELDWNLSIQQELEAEYSHKPVFVADKIQILK